MKYIVEDCPIHWESASIRDAIRLAHTEGYHPSRLLLGHCEAGPFRRYLNDNFEASVPDSLKDTYYLGLKVEEIDQEHHIAIDGQKFLVQPKDNLPPLENNQSPQWKELQYSSSWQFRSS